MELEDEIIRQAQAGNQDAFRQLVEHYAALTRRTARLLLPAHLSAEDAAQEAWVDVWRGLPRFQTGRPFRPWLLTLVANRCRMLNRHRQLTYTALDEELAEEVSDNKEGSSATSLYLPRIYSEYNFKGVSFTNVFLSGYG